MVLNWFSTTRNIDSDVFDYCKKDGMSNWHSCGSLGIAIQSLASSFAFTRHQYYKVEINIKN